MASKTHVLVLVTIFSSLCLPSPVASSFGILGGASKLIHNVCKSTPYYPRHISFCMKSLLADPTTARASLGALDLAMESSRAAEKYVNSIITGKDMRVGMKHSLMKCRDTFHFVAHSFRAVKHGVEDKAYDSVSSDCPLTIDYTDDCRLALKSGEIVDPIIRASLLKVIRFIDMNTASTITVDELIN